MFTSIVEIARAGSVSLIRLCNTPPLRSDMPR